MIRSFQYCDARFPMHGQNRKKSGERDGCTFAAPILIDPASSRRRVALRYEEMTIDCGYRKSSGLVNRMDILQRASHFCGLGTRCTINRKFGPTVSRVDCDLIPVDASHHM